MSEEAKIECKSIDSIIGASNLLKIVFRSDDFVDWLKKNHPDLKTEEIFPGYKFFLESAIGAFALAITYNKSLEITEDYVFFRADFYGADLNKYLVTCEKTAILKHIQKQLKLIKKAISFDQIQIKNENFSKKILDSFFSISLNNCIINSDLSYEKSLKFSTMEITHIRLMDCSHWVPDGYLLSPLRQRGFPPISGSQKDKFKDEFLGYKLTLQYLWSRLLGDKYEESKLVDLHKATDWTRYTSPDEMFGRKLIDEQKRTDLDRFYRIINTEIMSPIEKKWDKVRLNHLFCLDDSYSKKILEPLLSYQEKLSLTIDEKLKCTLLWYDIELLDASQNAIFNGVPAFVALMAGAVELKSKYANGERAIICKFTHPGNSNKNEYSYGVLIETGGSTGFTDYSGWVLSYDCCNDFTGFAGSGHQGAEDLIQEYASKDLIYIRQMNIDKKDFEKFLAENTTAGKKKDIFTLKNEIAETKRTYQAAIDESKGLLHEFISYYTISKRKDSSVDWNIRINGDQLDITCENADSYLIVECKVSSKTMDLESEIKKLKRKLIALDTKKRKIGQFWFYNQPSPAVHEYFKKLQQKYSDNNATIDDYVVISKIIKEDKNWRTKKTDKIETIFNEKSLKSPLADECKNPLSRFPNKKKSILEKIINRISK